MKLFEFLQHIGRYRVLVNSRDIEKDAIKGRHIADGAILSRHLSDKCIDDIRKFLSLEDLAQALSGMAGYYTKEEIDALLQDIDIDVDFRNFYTKAEVDQLLRTLKQGRYLPVAELPEASLMTMFTIYLVPSTNSQQENVKDEFITVQDQEGNYRWEQIGSTTIDLTGYLKEEDFISALHDIPAETTYKDDGNGNNVVDQYGWDYISALLTWLNKKYQAKGSYATSSQLTALQNAFDSLSGGISGDFSGKADKLGANFSEDKDYAVGEYVIRRNRVYQCIEAHSKGAWNSEHFEVADGNIATVGRNGNFGDSGKKFDELVFIANLAKLVHDEIPTNTVYQLDGQGNPTPGVEKYGWDKMQNLISFLNSRYQAKGEYLTEHQSLAEYYDKQTIDGMIQALGSGVSGDVAQALAAYVTLEYANQHYQQKGNYLTEHQSLADYALKSELPNLSTLNSKVAALEQLIAEGDNPTAAIDKFNEIVAFLASIENTETLQGILADIQSAIAARYAKPQGGIPATDFDSDTQQAINKAKTALQQHQSLADYATKQEVSENYQPKGNYLTEHQPLADYALKSELPADSTLKSQAFTGGTLNINPANAGICKYFYNYTAVTGLSLTLTSPQANLDVCYTYFINITASTDGTIYVNGDYEWLGEEPDFVEGVTYEFCAIWVGNKYLISYIEKGN